MHAAADGNALMASEGQRLRVGSRNNFQMALVSASGEVHDMGHVVLDRRQGGLPNGDVNVSDIQRNPLHDSSAAMSLVP